MRYHPHRNHMIFCKCKYTYYTMTKSQTHLCLYTSIDLLLNIIYCIANCSHLIYHHSVNPCYYSLLVLVGHPHPLLDCSLLHLQHHHHYHQVTVMVRSHDHQVWACPRQAGHNYCCC